MKAQIALVSMDEKQFALIVVGEDVLEDPETRTREHRFYEERVFRDMPVVLVNEDFVAAPSFYGPEELVDILEGVRLEEIEWTWVDLPFATPSCN